MRGAIWRRHGIVQSYCEPDDVGRSDAEMGCMQEQRAASRHVVSDPLFSIETSKLPAALFSLTSPARGTYNLA